MTFYGLRPWVFGLLNTFSPLCQHATSIQCVKYSNTYTGKSFCWYTGEWCFKKMFSHFSPPVNYFTDRSKVVLLLWIFYVFVLSCVCYVFVCVCLYVLCGHLLGKGWPLGARLWCLLWVCHFPIGILGQVWYLIVSIPDLCTLTYFFIYFNVKLIVLPKILHLWSI